ncbi:DNA binding domain-containing protein, excisionase family [Pedobacter terrae]|uniref:DNA binding domain-containing protein, excisionase family n=1 Tax=Pedobacter terrae TaxID=405671 RepID=A0A1G7Z4W4_9SPHI|nr:helix-turn-helix domain-containing protein [Pedobacter terrae]SDH03714.1 DNA binding domain-containing protein, excisionase family [Pedobacter terrae]
MEANVFIATESQLRALINDAVRAALENAPAAERPIRSRYFSTKEAADFIKKTPNALRQIVHKGEIPSMKRGNNLLFFEEDLVTWIEKGRREVQDDEDPGAYLK